jgi:hypothetical protein
MKKQELKKWANNKNVTLRFKSEESCTFQKEAKHNDDGNSV